MKKLCYKIRGKIGEVMARKSKGFNELLCSSKDHEKKRKSLEAVKTKLSLSKSATLEEIEIVIEPPDAEKMSDVLSDFIEPYMGYVDSLLSFRRLISMAIMAWNIALIPESEQQKMLSKFGNVAAPDSDQELLHSGVQILEELIMRKKRYFSQNKRVIKDFTLTQKGGKYDLIVVSTLPKTE